jgi:ribosomal protein L37AE/L43A
VTIPARQKRHKTRKRAISGAEIARTADLPRRFFHEKTIPGRCASCGRRGRHAHHVVYKQDLRRLGKPLWDVDNALALCPKCHELHHKRIKVISVECLTDKNIEYAFRELGAYAYDYLKRKYGTEDRRMHEHLAKLEGTA